MKTLITRIKRLALALCFVTPLVSWADAITAVNPVTGETETYTYKFIGTDTWNGTEYWQDSNGNNPSAVPAKSGDNTWDPILFDGNTININASMSVEGWNLRMGLYNGANVTMNNFVKYQGDTTMWMTVDENSQLTIGGFGGGNITDGQAIKLSVAKANGITWNVNLTSGSANNTFEYYLKGAGSVSYQAVSAANHKIKQADVALSGKEKSVQSKTLVSFTSTDKTFTADAAIKVKNGDNVLKTVYLTSVTADATTLTTDDDVGACELVQTSTGIDLYWVDGDPANLPAPTVYKPSININFTSGAGNGLTTQADVGLSGYEVPGTSWNNYVVANSTFSTVNAIDSTGAASAMSGVSVTISKTRGSWSCSGLVAASNPLHGYIDEESGANSTPTVTVTGIPYYKYRVLVYHSTDSASVPFGYDTINGTNYTYVEDALSEGSTAWGNSGAKDSANAIAEGGNVLVTGELSGSTLTVVGHRAGGDSSARGCIAAIQIIEVKADVGENDLEIAVDGETGYTVTAEDAEKTGTVYLTGSGTLTLAGENKISAATINVGDLVTLVVNADRLDATTFTGAGTVVYDGVVPPTGKGWTESAWTGTVWIKNKSNITGDNTVATSVKPNSLGNTNSKVKFSGVSGWIEAPITYDPEIVLDNAGYDYALRLTNGNSPNTQNEANKNRATAIKKLSGSGTLCCGGTSTAVPTLKVYDASGFTGSINTVNADDASKTGLVVVFCDENAELPDTLVDMFITPGLKRTVYVASGKTVELGSAATWTAETGFVVDGTLAANGTLASSHATKAVSGTGTVVFGGVPSPTGDAWWKNAAWTGTVEIKGATALNGDYTFNDYGNSGSTLKLTNCTGWLKTNYTCVPAIEIGGTFTWNDGGSGLDQTFKVGTLKGSGTISIPNRGAETAVWQITDDWSGFTGAVVGNNDGARRVLVFGPTLPTSVTKGDIYISEGATLDLDNSSSAWWGVGMRFVVDGTVKASARSKWGGGTAMVLGDTGVLELVTGANYVHDSGTNFSNVTGTGTVRYTGSSWRSLPDGANMFATTLSIELENDTGVVFNGGSEDGSTGTIGGLFGTKNLRTDLGGYSKVLTVKQAKNGLWSGIISAGDRLDTFIVDPGESTTGTLTLAGTHTSDNKLTVNGAVNLTGTWKGATTVAGTFGGTGTLTGDLTFSDGATFKAFSSDEDGLAVSGTVTCPEEGTVTVDVSAIEAEADVALLKASGLDATKFALAEGAPEGVTLEVVEGVLTLKMPVPTTVTITVPVVENATATVTVGGEPVEPTTAGANTYQVPVDSVATVTYAAASGYRISGKTEYTIDTASATTFELDESTSVAQLVARVRNYTTSQNEEFTTLAAAVDVADGETYANSITLLANIDEPEVTVSSALMIMGNYTISSDVTIADGGQLQVMLATLAGTLTIENGGVYVTMGGTLGTVVAEDGAAIQLTTLNETTAPLTITTLTVEGELTVVSSYAGAARGTTYKALSYVTANATIAQEATVAGVNEWSAGTVVDGDNTVVTLEITAVAKVGDEYFDDAQDAVDAAVASGNPVEFIISDPGTVTLGAGETLAVKGVYLPTVELEDGLTTPPYELETTPYDQETGLTIYTVVTVVSVVPDSIELYYNCTSQVSVVGYDPGSTFYWLEETIDGEPTVGSKYSFSGTIKPLSISGGRKTDTVKFYSNNTNGTWHLTALVTNNNEQVAHPVVSVTVKDVAAVVGGVEYSRAQFADAIADAIAQDEVLGLYLSAPNATLAAGETLRVKVLATRSVVNLPTVTGPEGTAETVYVVNKVKDTSTGITTFSLTEEEPSVMFSDGVTTEYYPANFKATKAGTYKLLKNISRAQLSVGTTGVVLDLNGKTFTSTATGTTAAILVSSTLGSASLTITGEGSIVAPNYSVVQAGKNGSVTIESGSLSGKTVIVYTANGGTVAIAGGTFAMVSGSASTMLNCKDDNRGTIAVTGGTFTGFDPANTSDGNMVADGYQSTETSTGVWTVDEIDEIPVAPGATTEPVDTEAEAEADAAKTVVDVPADVAAALGDDEQKLANYKGLFEVKVIEVKDGETTKYAVAVVLTEAAKAVLEDEVDDGAGDIAAAAAAVAASSTGGKVTVETIPGLYYVVEAGSELNGIVPVSCTLADGDAEELTIPNKGTTGFYKLSVSLTPVQVPSAND